MIHRQFLFHAYASHKNKHTISPLPDPREDKRRAERLKSRSWEDEKLRRWEDGKNIVICYLVIGICSMKGQAGQASNPFFPNL